LPVKRSWVRVRGSDGRRYRASGQGAGVIVQTFANRKKGSRDDVRLIYSLLMSTPKRLSISSHSSGALGSSAGKIF
jgi:hypothetical protein